MEISFAGRKVNLVGSQPTIKIGDEFRDAFLSTNTLEIVNLQQIIDPNKINIISTFPSVDTKTCDIQTRNLITKYSNDEQVTLINISEDLPFAQSRWCAVHDAKNAIVLSDYNLHDFGNKYGLLIEGINLLARSTILIVNNKVVYLDIVNEVINNINFDKLEEAINKYKK